MKKTLLSLIAVFAVSVGFAAAEGGGFMGWYKNVLKTLNAKIEKRLAPKVRISAVAAVRGADQSSDPMELYWKGGVSERAAKKLAAEKKEFASAVQKIVDGKTEAGRKLLKAFIKNNPDSLYIPDIKEALSKLPVSKKVEGSKSKKKSETKKSDKSKSKK